MEPSDYLACIAARMLMLIDVSKYLLFKPEVFSGWII